MAWLQGLAGKAETFLNRIDQTAAEIAASPVSEGSLPGSKSSSRRSTLAEGASHRRTGSYTSSASENPAEANRAVEKWNDFEPSFRSSIRRSASHQDVESSAAHGRLTFKVKDTRENDELDHLNGDEEAMDFLERKSRSSSGSQDIKFSEVAENDEGEANESIPVRAVESVPGLRETIYRENQLLKNELQTLRRDASMALSRAKRAEQDLQKLMNQNLTERRKTSEENTAKERDFMTALKAKDSQIAVLRVNVEEVETKLQGLQMQLTLSEKRSPVSETGSMPPRYMDEEVDILQRRIAELEESVVRERDHTASVQNQLALKLKSAEDKASELSSSLFTAETALSKEKDSRETVQKELASLALERASISQEFTDYKQKALTILQSKDDLIKTLKSSDGEVNEEVAALELAEASGERDMLRGEVATLQSRLDQYSKTNNEKDVAHRQDITRLKDENEEIRKLEIGLRRVIAELESSLQSQTDELSFVLSESTRKEQILHNKIKERESDLSRLRQQMLTRTESRPSEDELESRMRVLTESLIQKQTRIETLMTEKNSLVAQMESLESRLTEAGRRVNQEARIDMGPSLKNVNHSKSYSSFLVNNFPDNEVTRKFKMVYSTVDKFSFRMGTFLRRYPLARLMVVGYMFLLHFWVLIVLLTYTPEMHVSDKPISG